jgi:large subunit ribosomal protein L29
MPTAAELRGIDDAGLQKQLDDLYHEMFNLRFQRSAGQLPNFNRLKEVRHDIARVKTVMRERRTVAQSGEAKAQ